jgi:hypothetical protein
MILLALVLALQDTTIGARARAMGGAYAAFEDDPVSVWCNPAGIAAQPGGLALGVQTFARYDLDRSPEAGFAAPSLAAVVLEIGTADRPQALGFSFVSPIFLELAFDAPDDALGPNLWSTEQTFSRVRFAYARDFRFRAVGEEGWLPHLSVGLGADVGFSALGMKDLTTGATSDDSDEEYGGGFGIVLGLFDNTRNLKVNVGVSYQSSMEFDLQARATEDQRPGPAFGWPDQFHLGVLLFLLEGLPLRLTAELQMTDWRGASQGSDLFGIDEFARTISYALGAEYRVAAGGSALLYPRLGLRLYDAPWGAHGRAELPATEEWQLAVSTRDGRFLVFSAGLGVSFAVGTGMTASFDASFETGGDAPGAALGVAVTF